MARLVRGGTAFGAGGLLQAARWLLGTLLLAPGSRAAELPAAESLSWPRPAAVRELVADAARFRPFAERVSADVERALASAPAPAGDTRARLLSLRVHLGIYLGYDARALAAATQIRETITPPAERAFSGLLTEAMVVARTAAPAGPGSPAFACALRAALESRLATLPATPELNAVLQRQRDRFHALTREALLADATALGTRLDAMARWTLVEVDDVARIGHRLATLLPLRDTMLVSFETALSRRGMAAAFPRLRLHNGVEDPYDHARDPHAWHNLAAAAAFAAERARLARDLPAVNASEVVFADGRSMGIDANAWKAEAFR